MNRRLSRLQPYPFEKLRELLGGVTPPALAPIRLSIGEPQHETPELIRQALCAHLDGLATSDDGRTTIARIMGVPWVWRRSSRASPPGATSGRCKRTARAIERSSRP